VNDAERRAALAAAVKAGSRPGGLARACLLVARGEYTRLDPTVALAELKRLGELAAARRRELGKRADPAAVLAEVLGKREGFRGAVDDYDDPENSYLHRVLERRRGLPILLSILWIETARAAGWKAEGIPFPGHFSVLLDPHGTCTHVDPFRGGRVIPPEEVLAMSVGPDGSAPGNGFLLRATPRMTLLRVLTNLVAAYGRRRDFGRLERCLSDQIALDPRELSFVLLRGEARAELGDRPGALADFNEVLPRLPAGPLFHRVREQARFLARSAISLN
jgi:regulator of sirC expression with transglutaminase-like and TPR domain